MHSLDSKHSSKMQVKILFKYPVPKLYGRSLLLISEFHHGQHKNANSVKQTKYS